MPASCDYCGVCADCVALSKHKAQKKALIELAKAALKDEKHWTIVDVADRAENALTLAMEVLTYFNHKAKACLKDCEDCRKQRINLAESEETDDR